MLVARGYDVTCIHDEKRTGKPFYRLDPRIELINLHRQAHPRAHRRLTRLGSVRMLPETVRNRIAWTTEHGPTVEQLNTYFTFARPDVAISFLPPANTPALLASVGTDVKVIPTNHNVPAEDYQNPARWSANPVDRQRRLEALRHAAAIHVIFPVFGEWFPADLQAKITAIPNYVSKDILRVEPAATREKIILGVGRLAGVKNYATLIKAWALIADKHPDWKVMIYGIGPDKNALKAEIETLKLKDSFILAGHKSNLGEEYSRMSIFCHPAHFEGFGLSPAEALALGMPVVAFSDCPGVNQFVRDGYNGLLADRQGGPESLAAALDRLIVDDSLRQELAGNAPQSVSGFTEESFANAWVEVIERVTHPDFALG